MQITYEITYELDKPITIGIPSVHMVKTNKWQIPADYEGTLKFSKNKYVTASLEGIIANIKVTDEDVEQAKKSLFRKI